MSVLDITDPDVSKWNYLREYVPGMDYHKMTTDYRNPNNSVGHQQRAVVIYWAIKEHERTGGIGLELGCGQAISPFCIGTDYYSGSSHPVYGGGYYPHVRCMGEVLPFKDGVFDFIVSHHSLEHMKDTEKTIREWLRVLKAEGKIVIVMPDKRYGPFGDPSHVSECTPDEFRNVLERIETIRIIELDTLKNHFSFNAVIKKSNNRGDKMETETGTSEEVNLRTQMRTLWQDRVLWTRMLMVSIAAGLGEVDIILARLRKNQEDIGDALKKHIGTDNRNMLTIMLKNSITISKNLIKAKKTGDAGMDIDADEALKANIVSMASFLSTLNPNWTYEPLQKMLLEYLNLIKEGTIAYLNKKYDDDLAVYEQNQRLALKIADKLTDVLKQT